MNNDQKKDKIVGFVLLFSPLAMFLAFFLDCYAGNCSDPVFTFWLLVIWAVVSCPLGAWLVEL